MNLWQSLLLAGAGGLLTLLGTWLALRIQVQEQRRVQAETVRRDNLLRLHPEQTKAYTEFYRRCGALRPVLLRLGRQPDDEELLAEAQRSCNDAWVESAGVTLVGSQPAAEKARRLVGYVTAVARRDEDFDDARFTELVWAFVLAARTDLLYPDQPGTPPHMVWAPLDYEG